MKGPVMAEHKGKPAGKVAETKRDRGIRSHTRPTSPTPGAYGMEPPDPGSDLHPAGKGPPEQEAGGPDHHGADAHEDHNP